MLITVIVPVYNVENQLRMCCDSLLQQQVSGDYEILLIDDGSRDASGKICDEYAQQYPERIRRAAGSHWNEEPFLSIRKSWLEFYPHPTLAILWHKLYKG
ncbi:glycosyltransferase [uncultured Alistipes sp.]|mgnify:FL=1|uniref:glycosyltransferase family 2 protein n=1 Tax=uncultured Alistipes sp. TaxID=538949 RepID=UPI00262E410C|nr:glycosyltransferase [uncultured Alistipes sp.]